MLERAEGRGTTPLGASPHDRVTGASNTSAEPGIATGPEGAPPWQELSHELRTPLHAILGNVELLLDGSAGPLSAQARDCLGDVQTAGQQLLRRLALVQLLVQAMGAREPETEGVVDVVAALRSAFGERGMADEVDVNPDDTRLIVRGDPGWLETMASAVVEMLRSSILGGARISIVVQRAAGGSPAGELGLRVGAEAAEPATASPIQASLVEAIVRLHGGRVDAVDEAGLVLAWPAARVVDARTTGGITTQP